MVHSAQGHFVHGTCSLGPSGQLFLRDPGSKCSLIRDCLLCRERAVDWRHGAALLCPDLTYTETRFQTHESSRWHILHILIYTVGDGGTRQHYATS
jgi:hypothetical protein